jgi:hypothetical protein
MILTLLGASLMLAGIAMVVVEAGRNWRWPGSAKRDDDEKAKISYAGVVILAIGVVMGLIGASGSPPTPPAP